MFFEICEIYFWNKWFGIFCLFWKCGIFLDYPPKNITRNHKQGSIHSIGQSGAQREVLVISELITDLMCSTSLKAFEKVLLVLSGNNPERALLQRKFSQKSGAQYA